ncbi:MAG TPA: hypothetical protein VH302_11350 [Bryobacteraceae bacterium]|nr:hypothetical protein [Bryobacteraceae bacterium]
MPIAAQQAWIGPARQAYSTDVFSSEQEITALCGRVSPLLKRCDCTITPDFFLASVAPRVWAPRVITVKQQGELAGLVYTKERKVAGLPTGIFYGDATLNGIVAAEASERGAVFLAGIETLLKRKRTLGLRLLLPPAGFEMSALGPLLRSQTVDYVCNAATNHQTLALGRTYEEFLQRVGPRTRRNFRYYRRKFEVEGHNYVENIPLGEFRRAAERLSLDNVVGANREGMSRAFAIFSRVRQPILIGLRHKDGSWLALLGGWFEGARPVIFFQINSDKHHSRSSLCLVLRGYFFESLCRIGARSVVFWAGVGQPLLRYCTPVPTTSVYIDKRQAAWRGLRGGIASAVRMLPREMAWRAEWIVPAHVREAAAIEESEETLDD